MALRRVSIGFVLGVYVCLVDDPFGVSAFHSYPGLG